MITLLKTALVIFAIWALYKQYKALIQLTIERPEDFNPTKRYWLRGAIPFYGIYLVLKGEFDDYKNKKNGNNF